MTDEIKMCKLKTIHVEEKDDADFTVGGWDEERWTLLEPQPSCENCENSTESTDHLIHVRCNHPLLFMLVPRTFYCKYWKVKE